MWGRLGAKEEIKLLFKSTVRKAEQLTEAPLPPGNWRAEQWGGWKEPAVFCVLSAHSPGFLEHWSAQGNENRACLAQDIHPAPQLLGGSSWDQQASASDLPARLLWAQMAGLWHTLDLLGMNGPLCSAALKLWIISERWVASSLMRRPWTSSPLLLCQS